MICRKPRIRLSPQVRWTFPEMKRSQGMKIKWQDFIEERKEIMTGKPVFKGTRLTVEFVLKQMGAGMTYLEMLDQYPTLKPEHIRAAMLFATDVKRATS